jgi:hypothetical protein
MKGEGSRRTCYRVLPGHGLEMLNEAEAELMLTASFVVSLLIVPPQRCTVYMDFDSSFSNSIERALYLGVRSV